MFIKLRRHLMQHKKALLICGSVLLLLTAGAGYLCIVLPTPPSADAVAFVNDTLTQQKKNENEIQAYYRAGSYSLAQPLVIQDPYRDAPLTALVIFDTPTASQVSLHIPGKENATDVDFTFSGFQTHHEIPIFGLYADTLNHVTISVKTQGGENAKAIIDLQTEPLPAILKTFQVKQIVPDKYSPGFNFTSTDHKQIFDSDGNTRWYSTKTSALVFIPLKNGHYLFTYKFKDNDTIVMEQDLLGRVYSVYNIIDGIDHDICEMPNGHLLITSNDLKSKTIEDYLIEVDQKTGHIVRSFDMKDYLDPNRPFEFDLEKNDWLHMNSITYDATDQSILLSSKAQSAVFKFTYPSMQLQWILGPHDNWSEKFQPFLLTPTGDGFEWQWSQHEATLYGTDIAGDDSVDLLLFDNGLHRSFTKVNSFSPGESYSMVVHYRIDESKKTVSEVWEYGKENGSSTFSYNRGGAALLANGNVLGNWGSITKDAQGNPVTMAKGSLTTIDTRITEIDPTSSQIIFDVFTPNTVNYRSFRAGLYSASSSSEFSLSNQVKDTSGLDLYDRGVMVMREFHRLKGVFFVYWEKVVRHFSQIFA